MDEVGSHQSREYGILVIPDLQPMVSPIDGRILGGRRQLREYMKDKKLAHADELQPDWDREAKERARAHSGDPTYDSKRRVERIRESFEKDQARSRK